MSVMEKGRDDSRVYERLKMYRYNKRCDGEEERGMGLSRGDILLARALAREIQTNIDHVTCAIVFEQL